MNKKHYEWFIRPLTPMMEDNLQYSFGEGQKVSLSFTTRDMVRNEKVYTVECTLWKMSLREIRWLVFQKLIERNSRPWTPTLQFQIFFCPKKEYSKMKELPVEELSHRQEKRQKLPKPEHIKKQVLNESLRDSARSETIENSNGTIYSSFEEEESFQKKSSK